MNKVSKAILKDNSEEYKGCYFLEPREWLDNAIVGKCTITGGIIYDYNTLLECYMERDGISKPEAYQVVEWQISFTKKEPVDKKPVIQETEEDDCSSEEDWD